MPSLVSNRTSAWLGASSPAPFLAALALAILKTCLCFHVSCLFSWNVFPSPIVLAGSWSFFKIKLNVAPSEIVQAPRLQDGSGVWGPCSPSTQFPAQVW